jgi:hypothetical protein
MVANVDVFGGVNATCLKQATASTKQAIEKKIKDTGRCQFCNKKRVKQKLTRGKFMHFCSLHLQFFCESFCVFHRG